MRWPLLEREPMPLLLLLYFLLYDVTTPSVSHFHFHEIDPQCQNILSSHFTNVECQSYGCERGLYLVHDCCPRLLPC